MDRIKQIVTDQWADFLKDLQRVMRIASVKGIAKPNAPYGEGPRHALDAVMAIGKAYGFRTKIIDYKIGYVEWGPPSEAYIGIFGHLDVVPAGDGWSFPPFDLTEQEGHLYGRGILDNKGPIMSCLYGLKLLKELGVEPKTTIRIIFGTDEESGMSDIPAYLAGEPAPIFGFTPDCKYPVVYGERGIVNVTLDFPLTDRDQQLLGAFEGDQARGHVPDHIWTTVAGKRVDSYGQRAPSNAPELGKNALTQLAQKLQQEELLSASAQAAFAWIAKTLHNQHAGEGLGLQHITKTTDSSLVTPVIIQKKANGLSLELSVRYPVTVKEKQILSVIDRAVPKSVSMAVVRRLPSICHDKDSQGVHLLSTVYGKFTGTYLDPVTTTGATYARKVPNIVAFGPSFPGQKGIAHRENEYMAVADLKCNLELYTRAMALLINGQLNSMSPKDEKFR